MIKISCCDPVFHKIAQWEETTINPPGGWIYWNNILVFGQEGGEVGFPVVNLLGTWNLPVCSWNWWKHNPILCEILDQFIRCKINWIQTLYMIGFGDTVNCEISHTMGAINHKFPCWGDLIKSYFGDWGGYKVKSPLLSSTIKISNSATVFWWISHKIGAKTINTLQGTKLRICFRGRFFCEGLSC